MSDIKIRRIENVEKISNRPGLFKGNTYSNNKKKEEEKFAENFKEEKHEKIDIDVTFIITMLDSGLSIREIAAILSIEEALLTTFIYKELKYFDIDSYNTITSTLNKRYFEAGKRK